MSATAKPYVTPEQYLEMERQAEYKSEYFAGEIFAMAGASPEHNLSEVYRKVAFRAEGGAWSSIRQAFL